jgi:hypothetical protein
VLWLCFNFFCYRRFDRKDVQFINEETEPKEYPLTFGKLFTKEETDRVNRELDDVIQNTDLSRKRCLPELYAYRYQNLKKNIDFIVNYEKLQEPTMI